VRGWGRERWIMAIERREIEQQLPGNRKREQERDGKKEGK
jgi:hypothetical protein